MAGAKANRLTRAKDKEHDQKAGKTGKTDFQGFFCQMLFLNAIGFAMAVQFDTPAMSLVRLANRSNHFSAIVPLTFYQSHFTGHIISAFAEPASEC